MNPKERTTTAFTRVDLLALLTLLTLLALWASPVVAGLRSTSAVSVCGNNLRQIGRAYETWGIDHHGQRPGNPEFMRERTYWPELCVVQLGGAHEVAVVDALAEAVAEELGERKPASQKGPSSRRASSP